ncbi:hypothetical protein EJ03DRAFT_286881 [Teratosphaeria nubilosa]|uniref:Autophagy-related protein 14 n=1 Tax=Teratosphaeria nubilosa TaxID=161662 RepID=A0A6G1LLU0_9PEZI|nr:hypothetical protein EJ03DRAFT_286881 [Teratosphaeria nubilosa]
MASSSIRPPPAPTATAPERRDRSWLLPSNRKLRNLVSISLRNLSLAPTSPERIRAKARDDDAVPQSLKSPAKLVALQEQHALGHSKSSSDLRSAAEDADGGVANDGSPTNGQVEQNGAPRTPSRPTLGRLRRGSTLEWANATPQRRQEKLQNVTGDRMADVFFSVHVAGVKEPVYVSEVVERTMNLTFRHVDWSPCGPGIMRLDSLTLKFWIKSAKMDDWRELFELNLSLPGLQYLGKSLDQYHHALPRNAVVFHLTDGVYTAFQSLSDYAPPGAASLSRTSTTKVLSTSSFDTLLRLSKLDESIQDALQTRNKIAADLEALLEANKTVLAERDQVAEAGDRLKTIDYAKKTVHRQLEKARKQQEEKRAALNSRRDLMKQDSEHRNAELSHMRQSRLELPSLRDEHEVKKKSIQNQRRRVCEDLQKIYPVQPVADKSLAFTIRDIHLPNAEDLDAEPPDKIATAFGFVAHALLLLSFYMNQPLPYPVNPRSSTSTIEDPISLLKTTSSTTQSYKDDKALRTYPLFPKGVPRFRFEYGVFLLNKDIQVLLETAYNIRVLDIRQTLPNLKYLLYVATAGEGELPARKAGGIRGLMRSGTPDFCRTDSQDSAASGFSGLLWHGGSKENTINGKPKGAVDSLKWNIDHRTRRFG